MADNIIQPFLVNGHFASLLLNDVVRRFTWPKTLYFQTLGNPGRCLFQKGPGFFSGNLNNQFNFRFLQFFFGYLHWSWD